MTKEQMIFQYICKGYTKKQILSLINGLTSNQLDYIMRKNKWKVSRKTKAYAIYGGRKKFIRENVITRVDKNYKDCPFVGVSIHHVCKISKKTVFVVAITHNEKRYKKASTDIQKVLEFRRSFYKENGKQKLKQINRKEFWWFIKHPLNKFIFEYIRYKIKSMKK